MPPTSSGLVIAPLVLLASVLKPVDDTRMLGKFAATLTEAGYRVAVAGRASAGAAAPAGTSLHPLLRGTRLSLDRLRAQWRYWQLLRRRPALVVVHAPELLPLTLLWQRLGRGRQFVYDIRENYALNVSTQGVYQGWLKRVLAAGLRWVEGRAAARAAALTLAEASYADELPFLAGRPAGRVLVLENKYQPATGEVLPTAPRPLPAPTEPLRLLYSGTISNLNGVQNAVELTEALCARRPGGALLTIIGFCQQPELLGYLRSWERRGLPLRVVGGEQPVPHAAIVAEIGRSHLGVALYHPHPSTWRCRPTKLFEYLAHGLPVLIPANPLWERLVRRYDAGLTFDLAPTGFPPDDEQLLAALDARAVGPGFYAQGLPAEALWAGEGKKLRHLVAELLGGPTFAPASA